MNDYYARRYRGRLILRFDDTNPSKEKEEYQESIVVDLAKLGVKPDLVTYASDYFHVCLGFAKQMIKAGLAYMDDTPQEQMKVERANRQASKHRETQTPEVALEKFGLMCSGDHNCYGHFHPLWQGHFRFLWLFRLLSARICVPDEPALVNGAVCP